MAMTNDNAPPTSQSNTRTSSTSNVFGIDLSAYTMCMTQQQSQAQPQPQSQEADTQMTRWLTSNDRLERALAGTLPSSMRKHHHDQRHHKGPSSSTAATNGSSVRSAAARQGIVKKKTATTMGRDRFKIRDEQERCADFALLAVTTTAAEAAEERQE